MGENHLLEAERRTRDNKTNATSHTKCETSIYCSIYLSIVLSICLARETREFEHLTKRTYVTYIPCLYLFSFFTFHFLYYGYGYGFASVLMNVPSLLLLTSNLCFHLSSVS